MKNNHKIVLTGGHAATTALAVIEDIKSRFPEWKIYFIGVKNAVEGKSTTTLEYDILPSTGITFLPIKTGRLQRRFTIWTIPSIFKIPVGFFQSLSYLIQLQPKVVLSFGGFAAVPVVFAAKILGIPVIIHEQTAAAGRANQIVSGFADKIALARSESSKYFPSGKTILTGNPVTKEIASIKQKRPENLKTIFVTGGSRGSQKINDVVGIILPTLLSKYNVIHQTGELDFTKFQMIGKTLPKELAKNYYVFAKSHPSEMAKIFASSGLVIARAGANTVSDIMTTGIPAILIPLPISYLDEQTKNAKFATQFGKVEMIKQSDLSPETLLEKIEEIRKNYPKYIKNGSKIQNPDLFAAGKITDILSPYLK